MRIVFTGGHHNSSLEVLKRIRQMRPEAQFLWLGHRYTSLKNTADSAEYREVTSAGVDFVDLKAGKFFRVYNIIYFLRIPYGFFQAFYHLIKFRPNLIVSFGGYLAPPTVIAGWFLGIPSVTHEQTSVSGLANRVVGKFSKKVFISWPASAKYFHRSKTVLTGLPLRKSIFARPDFTLVKSRILDSAKQNRDDHNLFKFKDGLPTIYITGGKQGSHVINAAVAGKLPEILKLANVIHQTGANTETDDNEMLRVKRESLPERLKERYVIRDFVFENEIGSVFDVSDIIISRAGAHIIYEILASGKPSILIPISNTSHDEQLMNAKMVEDMGLGILLRQEKLNPETLYAAIAEMVKNIVTYQKNAEKAKSGIVMDAAGVIADEIIKLIENGKK